MVSPLANAINEYFSSKRQTPEAIRELIKKGGKTASDQLIAEARNPLPLLRVEKKPATIALKKAPQIKHCQACKVLKYSALIVKKLTGRDIKVNVKKSNRRARPIRHDFLEPIYYIYFHNYPIKRAYLTNKDHFGLTC